MKLFRFDYSNYCRKVEMALDLLGRKYEIVEVPYGDRRELLRVSGGLSVPVVVEDSGEVLTDSRRICQHLAAGPDGERLVPRALTGPIWGYSDYCDGPLEDILFRAGIPGIRRRFKDPVDRAMFTLIKERRYGAGCVDEWERDQEALLRRAREVLRPTLVTLEAEPFLFGSQPTLADAALYGQVALLKIAGHDIDLLGKALSAWMKRLPNSV